MDNKLKYLFLALFAVVAIGCRTAEKIGIDSLDGIRTEGITFSQARLLINLTVANESRRNVTIEAAEFVVTDLQGELLTASLREAVLLPKRQTVGVGVPVAVKFKGSLGVASLLSRANGDLTGMTVNGEVTVKSGALRKKIPLNDLRLNDLLQFLGDVDGKSLILPF